MIGLERGSEIMTVIAEQADELGETLVVPASALAQVWRGGPRSARLARLVAGCDVDVMNRRRAKEIGTRLGERGGDDVTDGHVASCAVERHAIVVTSDRRDIEALIEPDEPVRLIAV